METKFNSDETKRIREGIKEKYKGVAISPEGKFSYPIGRAGNLHCLKLHLMLRRSISQGGIY